MCSSDLEHLCARRHLHARDEVLPPARILAEGEQGRVAVVRRTEWREEAAGGDGHRHYSPSVGVAEELTRIAAAAAAHAAPGESVTGVVAAEPASGERVYLCSFERGEERSWLALDESAAPVANPSLVREAASITALCEVAEETAGGGNLEELRAQLVRLRLTEAPLGIEDVRCRRLSLGGGIVVWGRRAG